MTVAAEGPKKVIMTEESAAKPVELDIPPVLGGGGGGERVVRVRNVSHSLAA